MIVPSEKLIWVNCSSPLRAGTVVEIFNSLKLVHGPGRTSLDLRVRVLYEEFQPNALFVKIPTDFVELLGMVLPDRQDKVVSDD